MRLSPSDAIIQDLLEPALRSLREQSVTEGTTAGKVFFEYATFCTSQLEDQHAIADLKRIESLYRTKLNEASQYKSSINAAKQQKDENDARRLKKEWERTDKLANMDKVELERLTNLQQTFLRNAIVNFLQCFAACTDFDHHVPKFCAIWLKHSKQKAVNVLVANGLRFVPSYKFLGLLHQLCSRLSDEPGEFQNNLSELLSRVLNDHPYHSLHQIFNTISSAGDATAQSRSSAAKKLGDRMSSYPKVGPLSARDISSTLHQQFRAYSDLASIPVDKKIKATQELQFSSYPALRKFRTKELLDLSLPPPSMKIPVSPNREYGNIPCIQKYHHSFRIAGGVNQPKILDSVLSNGTGFRELVIPVDLYAYLQVKGGMDDLHQDAIMQQIFQEMDGVLQRNRETRRRKLRIRTYRVVPLMNKTGVIEWVLNTIPLLEYLERTHISVNPSDWRLAICRQKINDVAEKGPQKRLEVYRDICRHFKPVLRYFFLEYFKDPDSWLSRQINFSRSVAASSMIGHILGLGDRHGQNILLDKQTGEVVHIDLGIAFEQVGSFVLIDPNHTGESIEYSGDCAI
jgi:ataxia telangiectasia mutated family protein